MSAESQQEFNKVAFSLDRGIGLSGWKIPEYLAEQPQTQVEPPEFVLYQAAADKVIPLDNTIIYNNH